MPCRAIPKGHRRVEAPEANDHRARRFRQDWPQGIEARDLIRIVLDQAAEGGGRVIHRPPRGAVVFEERRIAGQHIRPGRRFHIDQACGRSRMT